MLLEAGMLSEADAPTAACSSWGSWRGGPLSLSASDRKEVRDEGAVLRPGFTSHMKGLCRFVSRRVACSSMLIGLVRVLNPDEM